MNQPAVSSTNRLTFSERDLDNHGIGSRTTRWRLRRQGQFPEPMKVGGRTLYRGDDIRQWLADPDGWAQAQGGGGDQ